MLEELQVAGACWSGQQVSPMWDSLETQTELQHTLDKVIISINPFLTLHEAPMWEAQKQTADQRRHWICATSAIIYKTFKQRDSKQEGVIVGFLYEGTKTCSTPCSVCILCECDSKNNRDMLLFPFKARLSFASQWAHSSCWELHEAGDGQTVPTPCLLRKLTVIWN